MLRALKKIVPSALRDRLRALRPRPRLSIPEVELYLGGWCRENGQLYPGYTVTAADTLIDVGCGLGWVSGYAVDQGADVVALDVDPRLMDGLVARMTQREGSKFRGIVSDGNPLPLPSAWASRVVCLEVLEHVDDPVPFLAEMVRVAKPGAEFLLSVPDPASESVQRVVAPAFQWQKPFHVRVFERADFEQLVTRAGLIIRHHHFHGFFWSMWWALHWLEEKVNSPFGGDGNALLTAWNDAWRTILQHPNGLLVRQALDQVMPKSQCIAAYKPNYSSSKFGELV